jgi:N-acetyl-anhydromuramyl-L-alanine amidase AmpD
MLYYIRFGGNTMIDIVSSLPVHSTKKPRIRDITPFSGDLKMIVVHTTNTISTIFAIAKYDISPGCHISSSGCPSYTYHDTIKENAKVYRCVPYEWETWHAGKYNYKSIAVAMNYIAEKNGIHYSPSQDILKSLYGHLGNLCFQRGISPKNIYGHRELKGTGWFWQKGSKVLRKSCPGLRVALPSMRAQAASALQLNLKAAGLYRNGRVDGSAGPKTMAALKEYHS